VMLALEMVDEEGLHGFFVELKGVLAASCCVLLPVIGTGL
jgi:hypothetical protein